MSDTKSDMISGELYQPFSKELYNDRLYCKSLCHELNNLSPLKRDDINLILDKLLNEWNEAFIEQPFHCTYGYNISLGKNFYSKDNLFIDDSGIVSISDNVTIGYNVTILTSVTPTSSQDRAKGLESTLPVRIYEGVCIGSNSIIYPGVKINRESIIEPGSVVKDDIPPFVIAGGNPCRVMSAIDDKDLMKK